MKAKINCLYLNKEGFIKYYQEYFAEHKPTPERAEKTWNRVIKETIDGVDYRRFEDHRDFHSKKEISIVRKYATDETIEEMEWFNL